MADEKENASQASSSGAGSSQQGAQNRQNNQTVQVFGNDLYSTAFILLLLLMGFLKVWFVICVVHFDSSNVIASLVAQPYFTGNQCVRFLKGFAFDKRRRRSRDAHAELCPLC